MALNASVLEANVTLEQIASALNLNYTNSTNNSEFSERAFNLYDEYRAKEQEQMLVYRSVACVLGTLIILSNLTVVVSSGLILKKGQQPKSTYLLLGNVSLADTFIGIAIIFGNVIDDTLSSDPLCIVQIGMIVCPTMVSIFSVGFIAIDRYIYILHGLYYQRWINATRVRIGIIILWLLGLILAYLPATGWTNNQHRYDRCNYITVAPKELVLFNAVLSLVPIAIVAILYSIILKVALKNLKEIKAGKKDYQANQTKDIEKPKLRAFRGVHNSKNSNYPSPDKMLCDISKHQLKRCSSTSVIKINTFQKFKDKLREKCKSSEELNSNQTDSKENKNNMLQSEISIITLSADSYSSSSNSSSSETKKCACCKLLKKMKTKKNEPCKGRAIVVVMLTTVSFLITWVPFFIALMKFVIQCDTGFHNPGCFRCGQFLAGPLTTLAYSNSFLNPLIYAWWHKGFQKAIKNVFRNYTFKKNALKTMKNFK